jgi:16S rRNA (cytosine967-C5)-methyltransferase
MSEGRPPRRGDGSDRGGANAGNDDGRRRRRGRGDGPRHSRREPRPRTDPRELALEVLGATENGAFADSVLGRRLEEAGLCDADRGLATLLVYGTLARQSTLDHTLTTLIDRRLADLDLPVRLLLRLALFQIAFLDRVPAYAAVDSAVTLARRHAPKAGGFINAVLRRAAREGLAEPPAAPPAARLAVETSHPLWLVEMWLHELGETEACALLQADNEAQPTACRCLGAPEDVLLELARRGIEARAGSWAPEAIVVERAVDLRGLAVPQSEASQLVVLLAEPTGGLRVLDACAAPGGKTAYLASLVGDTGQVVACDPAPGSGRRIRATLTAAAAGDNVRIFEGAVGELPAELVADGFDLVLVDAPCSGLGTLRSHPEIRWRRSPEDLADLAQRQAAILAEAARHVRPGARLVYSTCTIARRENDDVVDAFLATHPDFVEDGPPVARADDEDGMDAHTVGDPQRPPTRIADVLDARGRLRTLPHRHGTDGFFAVRMRRLGA